MIDSNNKIVSYPFSKFFNRFEDRADTFDNDEIVYANRKYNGFLAIVTVHDGRLLYHTAGSLSGEFVERIGRYVKDEWVNILDPNYTYMFECIATDDYHVTMEEEGLTLIAGWRRNGVPLTKIATDYVGVSKTGFFGWYKESDELRKA